MKKGAIFLAYVGRIFISLLFISSAINKILDWQNTERGLTNLLCDLQSYTSSISAFQKLFSTMLQWVPAILLILTIIELLGGLLVFFGVKLKFGSFLLLLFMMVTTFLFHHFWFLSGEKRTIELGAFLKGLAIIGGILLLIAYGKPQKPKPPMPMPMPPPSGSMPPKMPSSPINKG